MKAFIYVSSGVEQGPESDYFDMFSMRTQVEFNGDEADLSELLDVARSEIEDTFHTTMDIEGSGNIGDPEYAIGYDLPDANHKGRSGGIQVVRDTFLRLMERIAKSPRLTILGPTTEALVEDG